MHFGGVVAVDRVDFSLRENELRCLIGPNGAGKSTFFKCLTAQLSPTAGEVVIRDFNVTGSEPHQVARMGVGIKTQVPNVFDGLDVEENIWLSASQSASIKRARVITSEVIERLQLGDVRKVQLGSLAHGQRQQVELGMVLAGEPWLVILDEPTAGMTPDEVIRTADIIQEINKSATMIIVEHDMQFIRMIARRVTVFHQGQILIEGGMDEVSSDDKVREIYLGQRKVQ
ncbi:MAG: ATP-binding cassette domain-containing protein [Gammaproteobacteria bacterium]|jgi:branched-chain amino acid transport system ATP-binding protein/urea transport system ATP-binding protein|nr:ATP-binding cassette domain-containing protein [Gammaproteobacteria bacterium]|tara:strand:- start:4473 stop:5159 length:687 start_codon:yes stop_codon:yes gene_type:complete